MSCPNSCTPLKQVLDDRVIPLGGRIPCQGKTLKGRYCQARISRDRQGHALRLLECCIYCSRPGGLSLKYVIKDLAKSLVHQQHNGEQDAVYVRWRNIVQEFKNEGEDSLREFRRELARRRETRFDIIDEPVAPEPVGNQTQTHSVERDELESDQMSSLGYEALVEDDERVEHTVIHPARPNLERPEESRPEESHPEEIRESVSVQTDVHEVYTPVTLWSCFFGLILQCGVMIFSLFKIQFGPQSCDRARSIKKGSMVMRVELGIRWSMTDLPRWMCWIGISFLPLSILLGSWVGLFCICWIGMQLKESPMDFDINVYHKG